MVRGGSRMGVLVRACLRWSLSLWPCVSHDDWDDAHALRRRWTGSLTVSLSPPDCECEAQTRLHTYLMLITTPS
ncbi:hypothetical protein C8Q76DRAFT_755616 [Earliella scabrosa]|nr:hypothetical protein C8Q76DRAFT_755616 [Earliella scabrosa]